jgi:hypothetical protein
MYQHDLSTEGISQGPSVSQPSPENLTPVGIEGIEVKVEPTLTRVDSIEGGPRRITGKEKLRQRIQRVGEYLKAHDDEEWYGFKIGLAMVLSSVPVLVGPLYDYFGVNSLWLIISVSTPPCFLCTLFSMQFAVRY